MKRLLCILISAAAVLSAAAARTAQVATANEPIAPSTSPAVRFITLDVHIDSAAKPLAAYQFELACKGEITLVGVEGGEHAAFTAAPYYDPQANLNRRIVIAAFSTQKDLPSGRTRIARLMVAARGEPAYSTKLQTAADADGNVIPATITASIASNAGSPSRVRPRGENVGPDAKAKDSQP